MGFSVISHLLNRCATITRNDVPTPNGQGGFAPNARTIFANLPVRLVSANANEQLLAQQRGALVTHQLFADSPDLDIKPQDLVVVNGVTYRVQAKNPPSLDYFGKWQLQEIQRAD